MKRKLENPATREKQEAMREEKAGKSSYSCEAEAMREEKAGKSS
ncbi:hypothetical protein [Paenibacillus pectinilyticus]|nr:hypothetical protein [Paenibacillus pectinilyticus]